jgi:aspartyl aminopeptidase
MTPRQNKENRLMAYFLKNKYDKYGFTSLETLSTWNKDVDKNKDSDFICKKETVLVEIYNKD